MNVKWKRTAVRAARRWNGVPFTRPRPFYFRHNTAGYRTETTREWKYFDNVTSPYTHRVLRDPAGRPLVVAKYANLHDELILHSVQREYPFRKNSEREERMDEDMRNVQRRLAQTSFQFAHKKLGMMPTYFLVMDFIHHFRKEILAGKKCFLQPEYLNDALAENVRKQTQLYLPIIKHFFHPKLVGRMVNDSGDGVWRSGYELDLDKPLVREALGLLPKKK